MSDSISFCSIDENGVLHDENKQRITDPDVIEEFFTELQLNDQYLVTSLLHGSKVIVEAFDEPIVANEISIQKGASKIKNVYGLEFNFDLSQLTLDDWDRFHGVTKSNIPFVLNKKAQEQLFDSLDEYSDDSITFDGTTYEVLPYWQDYTEVESEEYWTGKYRNNEAGWDLNEAASGLKSLLPKLKLASSRIIVIGGGGGHDAAFFAEAGHHVTLVDISPEAIQRAKAKYGHLQNLQFIQGDVFDLPRDLYGLFDIVFEHTCFCAINPALRDDLIKQWRLLLSETGFLLGVFFAMPKRVGPPFGGSEWEMRQRLKKGFHTLIWQRLKTSIKPRLGRELLVYAQRKSLT